MQTLKKQINLVKNIFMIMEFEKIFPPHSVYICGLGGGAFVHWVGVIILVKKLFFAIQKYTA